MEFNFQVKSLNGQIVRVKCNDMFFEYAEFRRHFSEQDCLTMLEIIKRDSHKKMAIVFGNCQAQRVTNFLANNPVFRREYFFVTLIAIFKYSSEDVLLHQEGFWGLCDLLISQRINSDNKFNALLATQRLPQRLPEKTKIIWIPNVYFDGYFPQYAHNERNTRFDEDGRPAFPHADKYVDQFCGGGGGQSCYPRPACRLHQGAKFYLARRGVGRCGKIIWRAEKTGMAV